MTNKNIKFFNAALANLKIGSEAISFAQDYANASNEKKIPLLGKIITIKVLNYSIMN